MDWGSWTGTKSCTGNNVFLNSARYKSEPSQHGKDDTAGNSVEMICADGTLLKGNGGPWGRWSKWEKCADNTVICGIQTKVEPYQGEKKWQDDSALNEVKFACCEFEFANSNS